MRVQVVADDVTGACDVGAEFAAAGMRVRVRVVPTSVGSTAGLWVANTQSRALAPEEAYRRVHQAVRAGPVDVLLKKIDTALRGHPGAEIDAALEASGARAAFVIPAIPGAGRVTRGGRQWFDGRLLGETDFARDPEGWGTESSVAAIVARETGRPTAVLEVAAVRGGRLAAEVARAREGTVFVVDAETEQDVALAVDAVLALPPPVCLAGSITLAGALAAHREVRAASDVAPGAEGARALLVEGPVLVVSGSLHPRARAQIEAIGRAGLAEVMVVADDPRPVAARASASLGAGRSVALTVAPPQAPPPTATLRATEQRLAAAVAAIADRGALGPLALIGGETAYAVLARLGATTLAMRGRMAPLVARAEMCDGRAAGAAVVTKGGSGGDEQVLVGLLRRPTATGDACG